VPLSQLSGQPSSLCLHLKPMLELCKSISRLLLLRKVIVSSPNIFKPSRPLMLFLQLLDNLNNFESVSFLLKGLGSDYDLFVTSVTTKVDPLSIDELYSHLLAHEMRLEQQISFSGSHGRCSYFPFDAAFASRPTCQICGKFGHTVAHCYHHQDTSFADQQQLPPPQAYYSTLDMLVEKVWYLDTEATHHITNDLRHLNLTHEDYHGQDEI
jgi:hypothetical protein